MKLFFFPKHKNFKVKKHLEHYFGDKDQHGHMDSWRWDRRAVWVAICDSMILPNLLTKLMKRKIFSNEYNRVSYVINHFIGFSLLC